MFRAGSCSCHGVCSNASMSASVRGPVQEPVGALGVKHGCLHEVLLGLIGAQCSARCLSGLCGADPVGLFAQVDRAVVVRMAVFILSPGCR